MQNDPSKFPAGAQRWFRAGAALLVLGMVSTALAMTPAVDEALSTPWLWVLSMSATGAGLLGLVLGFRAQARTRSRATAAARKEPND